LHFLILGIRLLLALMKWTTTCSRNVGISRMDLDMEETCEMHNLHKLLITKNCQILVLNNFLLKYYQLYKNAARDKNHLFSSIIKFWEFFQNFLIPYFFMLIKIRKYNIKKLIKNSEKILRVLEKKINDFCF